MLPSDFDHNCFMNSDGNYSATVEISLERYNNFNSAATASDDPCDENVR